MFEKKLRCISVCLEKAVIYKFLGGEQSLVIRLKRKFNTLTKICHAISFFMLLKFYSISREICKNLLNFENKIVFWCLHDAKTIN